MEETEETTAPPTPAEKHAKEAERLLNQSSHAPMEALRTTFAVQASAHASLALYYQGGGK